MIASSRKKRQSGSRSRKKKGVNWRPISRILLAGLLLLVLTGGLAGTVYGIKKWISTSSYFFISSIEVHGEKRMTAREIISLSGIKEGDNIFAIDLKAVSEKLSRQPWIRFAEVDRSLPDSIVIHVEERHPIALARIGDMLFLVDTDGTCFKSFSESEGFCAPVITGVDTDAGPDKIAGKIPSPVNTARMADALEIINMSQKGVRALGYNNISQIDFPNEQTVVIYTADRAVPFYINREGLKKQFYRAEKILFQLYNSGQYPKVVSVNVGYGKDMALARLKKK